MSSRSPERLHIREAADGVPRVRPQAQQLMIDYLRDIDEHGELGCFRPDGYVAAQHRGTMSAHTVPPRS